MSGFFSKSHYNNHQVKTNLEESCGQFREIVDEYLNGFAALHYRDANELRAKLFVFFRFLTEEGIGSLDDVTPQTITAYLTWGRESKRLVVAYSIGTLSTFFKWLISERRRNAANPIVGLIHNAPKKHRLPRPLETDELNFMWRLLGERGDARTRFAAAVGEESGLRIGEICNLRTSDVDLLRQSFFVRLPNKTNRERWAHFSEKTKRYYIEWMAERDSNCGHDFLLHNTLADPLLAGTLANQFKKILCKTYEGKAVHETGFDRWSTHRLRHTMATNLVSAGADAATVMAAGGWSSPEAMTVYARVDEKLARRGYDEAMRVIGEQKLSEPQRRSLTPAELLKRRQVKGVEYPEIQVFERCV
jgi:integrase/recombinase XerC